jgi:hypothetical protein
MTADTALDYPGIIEYFPDIWVTADYPLFAYDLSKYARFCPDPLEWWRAEAKEETPLPAYQAVALKEHPVLDQEILIAVKGALEKYWAATWPMPLAPMPPKTRIFWWVKLLEKVE